MFSVTGDYGISVDIPETKYKFNPKGGINLDKYVLIAKYQDLIDGKIAITDAAPWFSSSGVGVSTITVNDPTVEVYRVLADDFNPNIIHMEVDRFEFDKLVKVEDKVTAWLSQPPEDFSKVTKGCILITKTNAYNERDATERLISQLNKFMDTYFKVDSEINKLRNSIITHIVPTLNTVFRPNIPVTVGTRRNLTVDGLTFTYVDGDNNVTSSTLPADVKVYIISSIKHKHITSLIIEGFDILLNSFTDEFKYEKIDLKESAEKVNSFLKERGGIWSGNEDLLLDKIYPKGDTDYAVINNILFHRNTWALYFVLSELIAANLIDDELSESVRSYLEEY